MPRAQIGVITENIHLAPGNHQAISEDSTEGKGVRSYGQPYAHHCEEGKVIANHYSLREMIATWTRT